MAHKTRWQRLRGRLFAIAIIPLMIFLCLGTVTVTLDHMCHTGLTLRLPYYPDAAVVQEHYNGWRAFGQGQTVVILETSDPIDTVRDWYSRATGAAMRRMQQEGQMGLINLTSIDYELAPLEETEGTQIILNGVCAS